jgi:hypothetical protein
MSGAQELPGGRVNVRHIRFVDQAGPGDVVLLRFTDPAPCCAVLAQATDAETAAGAAAGDTLEVALLRPGTSEGEIEKALGLETAEDADITAAPICVKARGVELRWRPGRAVLECDADQAELLLAAVVEFAHYEVELRRIEDEIARGWPELEQDQGLAFEVSPTDLRRSQVVGERMAETLGRRMRLARMEAHLSGPGARLEAAGQRLGEALREKAETEARAEIVSGQLEVFEGIYEMSAQRMGEYRAARQEGILEWVIIVLLAGEVLLMAAQALHLLA